MRMAPQNFVFIDLQPKYASILMINTPIKQCSPRSQLRNLRFNPRGYRDLKKKTWGRFFFSANFCGLTNLCNQAPTQI